MTIRLRIIAAFAAVLVILIALGINAFSALRRIGVEAGRVEALVDATNMVSGANGQVRESFVRVTQYALSETETDLMLLKASAVKVRDNLKGLDESFASGDPALLQRFKDEVQTFLGRIDGIIDAVNQRRQQARSMNETLTELQVISTALAKRSESSPDQVEAAIKLSTSLGASGIAALKYRFSRDPADMSAAHAWLDIAKSACQDLDKKATDVRARRFLAALHPAIARFETTLETFETTTLHFAEIFEAESRLHAQLVADGVSARLANSYAQHSAIGRVKEMIEGSQIFQLGASLLAISAGGFLALFLIRTIGNPLDRLTRAMRRLAEGQLQIKVPLAERRDEIGNMATAVAVFQEGLIRGRALDADRTTAQQKEQRRFVRIEALNRVFEQDVGRHIDFLSKAASEMTKAAETLFDMAARSNDHATAVAGAASQALSSVREVQTSSEGIRASVERIEAEITTSASNASHAVARAQAANVNVRALVVGADRIGNVVNLIKSIAQETNFLALNATIEAARAGSAGRGFAIVANEVKELAVAAGKATEQVGREISHIQDEMQAAAQTIEQIKSAIDLMGANTQTIAEAVADQSVSTLAIGRSTSVAARGADTIESNITKVLSASASTADAARQVLRNAADVAARSKDIQSEIARFLHEVQAA
jgi:methyl-accepting chemotaxis protein